MLTSQLKLSRYIGFQHKNLLLVIYHYKHSSGLGHSPPSYIVGVLDRLIVDYNLMSIRTIKFIIETVIYGKLVSTL